MHLRLTLLAILFSIPTYGISLLLHFILSIVFKDQSKDTQFNNHIKISFSKGKIVDATKIQWKDALHYAQEEGRELTTIDNMISFYIFLKKEKIYVLIARSSSGGVSISAYNGKRSKEISSSLYPY